MSSIGILPFEHPTTIALVDDDPDFVSSFGLAQMRNSGRLRGYTLPDDFLAAVLAQREEFVDPSRPGGEACVADAERFSKISVLVTDYQMGHLNGVELCRQIENRAIGRIMVTGKVDERFAVSAFNDNLIDRYLRKDDPQLVEQTARYVAELKREYFRRSAAPVSEAAYRTRAGFLFDPDVAEFFHRGCQENAVVEYYLSFDLPGFLMLEADGEPLLFILLTEGRLVEHVERAENLGAPRELVNLLRAGMVVPCFPGEGGFYSPKYAASWKDWCFTSRIVQGRRKYYQASLTGPAAHASLTGMEVYSYKRYLAERAS